MKWCVCLSGNYKLILDTGAEEEFFLTPRDTKMQGTGRIVMQTKEGYYIVILR